MGEKQIRNALKVLIDSQVIYIGKYSENPYDRTLWYSTDLGISPNLNAETDVSTRRNDGCTSAQTTDVLYKNICKPDINQIPASLISYLNSKTNRNYKPVKANLQLIQARLKEGFTENDIKSVIDQKVSEWLGLPKFSIYLRPETLFNATKFAQYHGQITSKEEDGLIGGEKWE